MEKTLALYTAKTTTPQATVLQLTTQHLQPLSD
jgi:hypothetical protein